MEMNNAQQQSLGQAQSNGLLGTGGSIGYCPHCAPKCPCCGRPYGNYGYPYYQYPQIYCQTGIATMQANAGNPGAQTQ